MRAWFAVLTTSILIAAVAFDERPQKQDSWPEGVGWIKLTFGLDEQAVSWDGSVSVRDGRILQSAPWSFEERDRFDPVAHKWYCNTVVLEGRGVSSFAEPQRGVLLEIQQSGKTRLVVSTRQGDFTVDLDQLQTGQPTRFLNGRASAELLGTSRPLPDAHVDTRIDTHDDFPSLAIDEQGQRWMAWIGYDETARRDHLWVLNLDDPAARVEEIATAREQSDPRLLVDSEGALRLFWSAPQDGNWDLWTARRDDNGWSAAHRLTTAKGTDFHLATAHGPQGEIWLAWQTFRNGNSDILARRWHGGTWSPEIAVAATDANEWAPSISVDPDGRAWIGYDSYRHGNYDVFLTHLTFDAAGKPQPGETIPIAASADFEAHAQVEATGDRVWVAYDAAGPNWGKDYTRDYTDNQGTYTEPLHASRRIELRAVVDGQIWQPEAAFPQKLNKIHPEKIMHSDTEEYKRFYELPQLVRDGAGRLWVFFRLNRQGYAGHPKMGANWEFYATTYAGGKWLEPLLLPLSVGRQSQQVSTALDEQGRIHVAWATGDHLAEIPQQVRFGTLPALADRGAKIPLERVPAAEPVVTSEPVVRSWKMHYGGETYQVYFGDLHRHTDISLCLPTTDGCLVDAFRYALDAARLDFLAITNHTRDTDPYPWWRTQKTNDLFDIPGTLAPIHGYERSNGVAGGGHRNVFFLERDWPVLRSDAHYSWTNEQRPDNNNPDVALYPHLRGKDAITAAHTPGYSRRAQRGTWTYHDPQVEPLAEIIQTYRRDYERPGAPQWRGGRLHSKLPEEASLWYALAQGHKLGFIASSDHNATHTSFACVWAKGPKREEIFEGLRSRRTYAATDKILLEVRMGEAVMGEQIAAPDVPTLSIRARGTAAIEEVQVVRNRTVVLNVSPDTAEVKMDFRDDDYPGGAAYYYVRIRQTDGNMAWGSPIWIE